MLVLYGVLSREKRVSRKTRIREPPVLRGSARKCGANVFSTGDISEMNANAGARTSASYCDLFSSNQILLLLAARSSRNLMLALVNMVSMQYVVKAMGGIARHYGAFSGGSWRPPCGSHRIHPLLQPMELGRNRPATDPDQHGTDRPDRPLPMRVAALSTSPLWWRAARRRQSPCMRTPRRRHYW